jgi:hypothetical protein
MSMAAKTLQTGGILFLGALMSIAQSALAEEKATQWNVPPITLKSPTKHPMIAATPEEIARLRDAWKKGGAEKEPLAERFARADAAIAADITFPPEGGHHNQWYQCTKCQLALKTVDATHHQCPKCQTVYSGFPFDNVLFSKTHSTNIKTAEDAAWTYTVTGEKKYADLAAKILTGYAERYLQYPMLTNSVGDKSIDIGAEKNGKYKSAGHINNQTLGEAMLLIPISISYDLIYDSGVLSDAQKKDVETKLIRAMADCINVHRAGKNNWQTWHNAAHLYAGAVLGDEALVKQAILDPKHGFVYQMSVSVSPEGMWYENSWGYHYYTLMALSHTAEGARRLGIDLYSHPLLKKMYLLAFDYQVSDGSLPRFGDAVQDSPNRPSVNEAGYAVYKDPRLLPTLPAKPSFDSVLLGRDTTKAFTPNMTTESTLFPGAGHAILRTNGPAKLSAAMTFGPFGGFHGHFDKNTFVFFGHGQELGVDPGRAASQAYRLPIHSEWYRATVGHNGILVDGEGQKPSDGELISYAATPSHATVAAKPKPYKNADGTLSKAYENVEHTRMLVLTPHYLLVVDNLKSLDGKPHTFDWLYHNTGKSVECKLPEAKEELGANPGYKYLADLKSFTAQKDQPILITIPNEKVDTHIIMSSEPEDVVFTATGPVKSVDDRAPMLIVRRKGENVSFVTVIEPTLKTPSLIEKVTVGRKGFGIGNIHQVTIQHNKVEEQVYTGGGLGNNVRISKMENGAEVEILRTSK